MMDGLMRNVHRNEAEYLNVLQENGVYTQRGRMTELYGAHWNKSVRGFTIQAIKLLIEHTDRNLIERLSNTYSERILLAEIERNKRNKLWKKLELSLLVN